MLVYGDAARLADPREELKALGAALCGLQAPSLPIERHAWLASLFIAVSELAQGLADAALDQTGVDGPTPDQDQATALLMILAAALLESWKSLGEGAAWGDTQQAQATILDAGACLECLGQMPLPPTVRLKSGEGYAFYALYPEAYAAAARQLPGEGPTTVIGVRSIGLGLAAVVAAALGAEAPVSVRPVGHPFRRTISLSPAIERELRRRASGRFVIVDEGPGLSGSSFGAVSDALEALGIARESISFLPSHGGDPGPQAQEAHRQRWRAASRPYVTADALVIQAPQPGHRLAAWFSDLTDGEPRRVNDVSGGGWRRLHSADEGDWPAVDTFQERRKLLLHHADRRWLLKFAGLGARGERAFEQARKLGEAGFCPAPVALRYGFMATPWLDGAGPLRLADGDRTAFAVHLGRYLGWRAAHLPAPSDAGAGLPELLEMARVNAVEALGEAAAAASVLQPLRWASAPPARRVWTDNRLHAREWLSLPEGGWLKTDAVEHAAAHDLVGAQDIAWDVAGARVEFGLDAMETALLLEQLAASAPVDPDLVALLEPAYLAFQLGSFSMAADAHGHWSQEQARLRRAADAYRIRLIAGLGLS